MKPIDENYKILTYLALKLLFFKEKRKDTRKYIYIGFRVIILEIQLSDNPLLGL
jgi:hypothetical protein